MQYLVTNLDDSGVQHYIAKIIFKNDSPVPLTEFVEKMCVRFKSVPAFIANKEEVLRYRNPGKMYRIENGMVFPDANNLLVAESDKLR